MDKHTEKLCVKIRPWDLTGALHWVSVAIPYSGGTNKRQISNKIVKIKEAEGVMGLVELEAHRWEKSLRLAKQCTERERFVYPFSQEQNVQAYWPAVRLSAAFWTRHRQPLSEATSFGVSWVCQGPKRAWVEAVANSVDNPLGPVPEELQHSFTNKQPIL